MIAVRYLDLADKPATGVFWCPGPQPRSLWVLPHAGARSSDAVVVKLPSTSNPTYHQVRYVPSTVVATGYRGRGGDYVYYPLGQHHVQAHAQEARHAPPLEPKDIKALDDQEAAERAARLSWGRLWDGDGLYHTPAGPVRLYQSGRRCKWLDAEGYQHGALEHLPANAIDYAREQGWRSDLSDQPVGWSREELVSR
jgi:hypothetical protein